MSDIALGVEKNDPWLSPGGARGGIWKGKGKAGTVPLVSLEKVSRMPSLRSQSLWGG